MNFLQKAKFCRKKKLSYKFAKTEYTHEIFQAPELTLDAVMWLLDELESITELGDLHSMELAKNNADIRKLHQEIKKNKWNVSLIDSSQGIETEDRDFGKLQGIPHGYIVFLISTMVSCFFMCLVV